MRIFVRFLLTYEIVRICSSASQGEVTEWPIVHPWKGCVLETVPRVRIPPSPPGFVRNLFRRTKPVPAYRREAGRHQAPQNYARASQPVVDSNPSRGLFRSAKHPVLLAKASEAKRSGTSIRRREPAGPSTASQSLPLREASSETCFGARSLSRLSKRSRTPQGPAELRPGKPASCRFEPEQRVVPVCKASGLVG